MKHDIVFKRTLNDALALLEKLEVGTCLLSENAWAAKLTVSRTTVRKILLDLLQRQIVTATGKKYFVARSIRDNDYFSAVAVTPTADRVERMFMEWMLRDDRKPGDFINGLELARRFGVSPGGIRDYLNRFSRFGLIEKRPNSSWVFRGFTREFALELFEVRELFEVASARAFAALPPNAPEWAALDLLVREHRDLLDGIEARYHDFSNLDNRFHHLVSNTSGNRFFIDFHDVISLIFHYHYQWNKVDELERNKIAVQEHLSYIEALFSRDVDRIEAACRCHLASARKTLLQSIA